MAQISQIRESRMFGLGLETWNVLTLIFMGAAALAAVLLVVSQLAVIRLQRQEAIAAEERIEELRKANLELEAQIAPRRLDTIPMAEVISPLAGFEGKKVKLASYALDAEGAVVAVRIYEALKAAKLEVDKEQATGVAPFGSIAFGVFVDGPDRELVAALVKALAPIKAVAAPIPHNFGETDAAASIFVAAKPPLIK